MPRVGDGRERDEEKQWKVSVRTLFLGVPRNGRQENQPSSTTNRTRLSKGLPLQTSGGRRRCVSTGPHTDEVEVVGGGKTPFRYVLIPDSLSGYMKPWGPVLLLTRFRVTVVKERHPSTSNYHFFFFVFFL